MQIVMQLQVGLWLAAALALGASSTNASGSTATEATDEVQGTRPLNLVEDFTATMLSRGEFKIGTDTEYGLTNHVQLGTDLVADLLGAPTIQIKGQVWSRSANTVALGLRGAWLTKETVLWGSLDEHFTELSAKVVRPSVVWTHVLSERLKLHTYWGIGIGKIDAVLSEKGRRKLWSMKYRDKPYPEEGTDASSPGSSGDGGAAGTDEDRNLEAEATDEDAIAQRSTQVASIAGLAQDRFQITGEFARTSGNKILLTSRVERTELEEFRSQTVRFTISQHWSWGTFQFRLGGGVQYLVLDGRDLDGETLDSAGWWPATDAAMYWRF